MNNEEKKDYILNVHKLYMESRPYDNNDSLEELKSKEEFFWNEYCSKFYELIPKSFYKYRKPNDKSIKNFKDDTAWFSHPSDFDDTVDSVLNNDIETEIEEYEKNSSIVIARLAKTFIGEFAKSQGFTIDLSMVDDFVPLFDNDGKLNEVDCKDYLLANMPEYAYEKYISQISDITNLDMGEEIKNSISNLVDYYMGMNDRIKNEMLVFSLAEESDNQALWSLYAEESKGFCIEYVFPKDEFLGQRMLLNLFPVYYGEKPLLSFFDLLNRGIQAKNSINGISFEDYQTLYLSSLTKDINWSFQKEWRIVLDNEVGKNLQNFPFVKSIILGERMSEEYASQLIEIAKDKKIDIFQRQFNKSKSKIIIKKIVY